MGTDQVIQAAYYACIAIGEEPSSRAIEEMVRRIRRPSTAAGCPRGIRRQTVVAWLANRNGNHLGTAAEPLRNRAGTTTRAQKTDSGTTTERTGNQAGTLRAGVAKVLGSEKITPEIPSVSLPPKGREQPKVTDVEFGDLEADVDAYVANAAAENASGKITPGRVLSLRRELHAELDSLGDRAAFARGLRAANAAGAPNPRYVRRAATSAAARGDPVLARPGPARSNGGAQTFAFGRSPDAILAAAGLEGTAWDTRGERFDGSGASGRQSLPSSSSMTGTERRTG